MRRRLVLVGVAAASMAAAPEGDLDGDGADEELRVDGERVTVASGGRVLGELKPPAPPDRALAPVVEIWRFAGWGVVHVVWPLAGAGRHPAGTSSPSAQGSVGRHPAGTSSPSAQGSVGGHPAGTSSPSAQGSVGRHPAGTSSPSAQGSVGRRAAEVLATVSAGPSKSVRTMWAGVTGPQGRDGEWALHVRAGEGGPVLYQTAPGVRRCDGEETLFPELWDRAGGRFRAVSLEPPAGEPLAAVRAVPAEARRAPRGLFRFVAASSQRGDGRRADALAPPRALDDGDAATAWYEGMAGWGRGAWVTARARAPSQTVTGVKLVPAPGSALRAVVLLFDSGSDGDQRRYRVTLPANARAGEALWVALPSPVPAACVSVALADAAPGATESGLAEVGIYTALDGPDGLAAMARAVASGAPGSDALAAVLGEAGAEATAALGAELVRSQGPGQTRLARALLAGGAPAAAAPLVAALVSGDADAVAVITEGLGGTGERPLGEAALAPLLALAADGGRPVAARAAALHVLGRWRRPEARRRLVDLLLDGQLADAPALAGAVVVAVGETAEPAEVLPRLGEELDRGPRAPEVTLRLVAALGGRARTAGDAASVALVERASASVTRAWAAAAPDDFALRFRTLRAARALGHGSLLALVDEAARAPDEALRWAAVAAAGALDGAAGATVVDRALGDGDPRVRATALGALAALRPAAVTAAATRALDGDRWPLVQRAAADLLGATACPDAAGDALARAAAGEPAPPGPRLELGDEPLSAAATPSGGATAGSPRRPPAPSPPLPVDDSVRRAALDALGHCDARRAGSVAVAVVANTDALPSLRAAAATLAARARAPGAARALAAALEDVLADPLADERAADLAVALARGLGDLADRDGEGALLRAAVEPLSPSLRVAALGALAGLCTPKAARAIAEAAADAAAEPPVRDAATAARKRCPGAPGGR